jgi:hypothetical protein
MSSTTIDQSSGSDPNQTDNIKHIGSGIIGMASDPSSSPPDSSISDTAGDSDKS